jgi:hypothetical protein
MVVELAEHMAVVRLDRVDQAGQARDEAVVVADRREAVMIIDTPPLARSA